MLSACLLFAMTACGGSSQEEPASDTPKSEQTGTAGSNIPLKDDAEAAEAQITTAMQDLLKESYGDKITDSKIFVEKIYSAEDEQALDVLKDYNLSSEEVAFEVRYELLPAEGVDLNELLVANGEFDEESGWIVEKYAVGVLRPNGDGTYKITDFGTGW